MGCIRTFISKNRSLKNAIELILNLFFRNNNLIVAYCKAYWHHNCIFIDRSAKLQDCKITVMGGGNFVKIGKDCWLKGMNIFICDSNNRVEIGDNVRVNASIKRPTSFNACNGSGITIGDNCLFSNGISLHTTDYHPIFNQEKERTNYPKPIVIGDHTWVGFRTVILKGVELKPKTIVGACSLVVKSNDESFEIIAGSPAVVVKRKHTWSLS